MEIARVIASAEAAAICVILPYHLTQQNREI